MLIKLIITTIKNLIEVVNEMLADAALRVLVKINKTLEKFIENCNEDEYGNGMPIVTYSNEKEKIKSLCEDNPISFTSYFFRHLNKREYLISHCNCTPENMFENLIDVYKGDKKNLVIYTEQRSGGSTVLMYYVAWCLMKNPSAKFIYQTFNIKLTIDKIEEIKNIIESPAFKEFWPHIKVSEKSNFCKLILENGGGVHGTCSEMDVLDFTANDLGGIIYDDPMHMLKLKSSNKDYIDGVVKKYKEVTNKRESKDTPIIIHSKYHEVRDLTDYVLSEECEESFEHLKLPKKEEI